MKVQTRTNKIKANFTEPEYRQEATFPYSSFVSYRIELRSRFYTWSINKRFSDFCTLVAYFEQTFKKSLPSLPEKVFFNLDDEVVSFRKNQLELIVNEVLGFEPAYKDAEIRSFLEIDNDLLNLLNVEEPGSKSPEPIKKKSSNKSLKAYSMGFQLSKQLPKKNKSFDFIEKIATLTEQLNTRRVDTTLIVDDFEACLVNSPAFPELKGFEIKRLLFGNEREKGIFQLAGDSRNSLGSKRLVSLLANLMNCEFNPYWEFYRKVLIQAAKSDVEKFEFNWHLINSNQNGVVTIIVVLSKKFDVDFMITDADAREKFYRVSQSRDSFV